MGTNFYARRIATVKERGEALVILTDCLNGDEEPWILNKYLEDLNLNIHLGKRSCGWQFHWQEQPDCYEPNLKSIKEFLSKPDIKIYDEYGRQFTIDEFFDEEIGYCLYLSDNCVDCHTYYDKHSEEYPYFNLDEFEYTTEDGLRFSKGDFS